MGGINESADRSDVNESAFTSGTLAVGTTAVEAKVGATRLVGRQYLTVHNTGPGIVYLGTNTVTSSTGRPLLRDQSIDLPVGNLAIYLITAQGTSTVIVQELG